MTDAILIILAIALSIYLGEVFNINTGLVALAFAYLIGCFVVNMSVDDLLATFPTQLFLVIFAVSLFFNFAVVNGTLNKVASWLLYKFRRFNFFLPLLVYFITALVSGLGAGFFTSVAIMGAMAMVLCRSSDMNRMHASFAVGLGSLSGANFMPSAHGVLFKSLFLQTKLAGQADSLVTNIFVVSFVYPIIVLLIMLFTSKHAGKKGTVDVKKPEAFSSKQKVNLWLIILLMVLVLFTPALAKFLPHVHWLAKVAPHIDISFLAIVFSILAYLLKLADKPDEVLKRVPWDTIWLVSGVGMLIGVAVKAGTIDLLASLISHFPSILVPVLCCIIAGIMSIFSSTLGVVAPLMFPMIYGIAQSSGWSPSLLAVAIIIGAQSTTLAPFSTGGSLILGESGIEDPVEQRHFYNDLLYKATPLGMGYAVAATIVLMFIYR
ncbi:SLC13 family permease [Lacticaseibacillus baoqingensis]|uniref:SLC13 family permease n=1 Tax=Lacticaseibacillus baoqingensis TaxID=2486013 RepID=A0ABW4E3Q4_9LACO|nr:SLC13 family permease [Lacticaseibacillus baoqingensis]